MIKSTDFIKEEAKRNAETEALGTLLDVFAKEVGAKIFEKLQKGYSGWDDSLNEEEIKRRLLTNYHKGDMVDVAACAMFLWNLKDK